MNRKKTVSIGKSGVLFIDTITNHYNDIFQKIDQENDCGFDGIIEFVEEEKTLNYTVACQIKSGKSYFKENSIYIQIDEKHFNYWKNHNLYSFLFVYNNDTKKCYWLDLTRYLSKTNEYISAVKCDLTGIELNENTYETFREYVMETKQYHSNSLNYVKVLEDISNHKLLEKLENSIDWIYVLQNNRNNILTWKTLINFFFSTNSIILQSKFLYLFKLLTSNPDIWWHTYNIVSEEVKDEIKWYLNTSIKLEFVKKLIAYAAKTSCSIERGTDGQVIFHIIEEILDINDLLINLAVDSKNEYDLRIYSMYYIMHELNRIDQNKKIELIYILYNDKCINKNEKDLFINIIEEHGGWSF